MKIVTQRKIQIFLYKEWLEKMFSAHSIVFKFIIAGGIAAIIDLGVLYILTAYVGFHYLTSVALAFITAFIASFTLQKFWTFRDHSIQNIHQQSIFYFAVSLGNFFLNTYLVYVSVEKIHIHYLVAQILVGGMIACLSFVLYKYVIFARQEITI